MSTQSGQHLHPKRKRFYTVQSTAVTVLAVLGVLYTLYFARSLLLPVAVALMLHLLFSPLISWARRHGIHSTISAVLIIGLLLSALFGAGAALVDPASEWLKQAPTNVRQLAREFEQVKQPLEGIKELSEEVTEITEIDSGKPKPPSVKINDPTALDRVMQNMPEFATSLAIMFLTAFFLMAGGDAQSRRILAFGRSWKAKRRIIRVTREIQAEVSRHLRTVTLINIGLGVAVALALWQIDVPNPPLWGTMVAVLNFAPYVGAIVSTVILTVVGISTFGDLGDALTVPGLFLLLNATEFALITPLLLGRSLSLNPLVVFLAVIAWGWMWGIAGALIAVPLVSTAKVILSHAERTRPLARLLES
ncbi:AI-2E family transporter [Elongatibacter sediminis]|uniref:AI-2E family transporter n=1 Tax=Elongatibacter sediminis TaxID=3119006 RepID=A0AAW9RH87_9GAMM